MAIIYRETHQRDGVQYEIRIEDAGGAFHGGWYCRACSQSGQSLKKCRSIDEAVVMAQGAISAHLAAQHSAD